MVNTITNESHRVIFYLMAQFVFAVLPTGDDKRESSFKENINLIEKS